MYSKAKEEIKKILKYDYDLQSGSDLETMDGEVLAELYDYLKAVQEDYDLSDNKMEIILENIF